MRPLLDKFWEYNTDFHILITVLLLIDYCQAYASNDRASLIKELQNLIVPNKFN